MDKLLVIDDSIPFLRDIEILLGDRYQVLTANSGTKGMDVLKKEQVAVVLLDLMLPDGNGNELIKSIHQEIDPLLPVMIVTDHANVENAVVAMRNGAYDFLLKNFNRNILFEKIEKALERRRLEIRVAALQGSFADLHNQFVFRSEVMKQVQFEVSRLAGIDFDVLLVGETGVGKDLVAYEIHRRSVRSEKPFLPVSMKALSETLIESELFGHERGAFSGAEKAKIGKLEAADGGTLYIPEISSLGESIQLKLLHFMQYKSIARVGQDPTKPEKKLNVRLIIATNEQLEDVVEKKQMRSDFYHRISGVKLTIPPLRDRIDDIEPLAYYFLKRHGKNPEGNGYELSPEVIAALKAYRWPGNVRELENWIKSALAYSTGRVLKLDDFPHFGLLKPNPDECMVCFATRFQVLPKYKEADLRFKRAYFTDVLRRANHRISQGASMSGLTYQGFAKILKTLGIE